LRERPAEHEELDPVLAEPADSVTAAPHSGVSRAKVLEGELRQGIGAGLGCVRVGRVVRHGDVSGMELGVVDRCAGRFHRIGKCPEAAGVVGDGIRGQR
jgi:hypothetical protein